MGLWDEPRAGGPRSVQQRAPQVFLAYSPTDHQFAYTLTNDLRQRGVAIQGDPAGATASALARLAQSVTAPEWLVIVLSPSALWSSLIGHEMRIATELIQRQRLRGVLAITAAPVPPADIPPQWPITHSFDATRDYPAALGELCAALGVSHAASASQPPAPASVPAPSSPPDVTRLETALVPTADLTQEETTQLPVVPRPVVPVTHDIARAETTVLPAQTRAPRARPAGPAPRKTTSRALMPGKAAPKKGLSRRALLGAGFAVAATAMAGGSFYLWRTAPGPLSPAPAPTVRWRYLINSNATTPALEANGAVYVGTADGHFYALDAASQTLRWAYDAKSPIRPDDPVAEKGAVYCCASDGSVFKLNNDPNLASDAQRLLWRFQQPRALVQTPALSAGVLYVSCQHYRLFAVNSQAGDIIWTASPPFNPTSPPTLDGGRLYVAALDAVFALESSTNAPIWKTPVGGLIQTPIPLSNGTLYACMKARKGCAFDAATGRQRWTFATSGLIFAPPIVDETLGAVYFGDDSGYLYALDAQHGKLRWRQKLDSAVVSPKLINGRLYAASSNGYLYALDAPTGFIHWQAVIGQGVVSPLGAGANTLYVGGADGFLYALDAT